MADNAVKAEVSQMIDTDVIAEALLEDIKDYGHEPTFENAKKLWLDFLGNELGEGIRSTLKHSPEFNR